MNILEPTTHLQKSEHYHRPLCIPLPYCPLIPPSPRKPLASVTFVCRWFARIYGLTTMVWRTDIQPVAQAQHFPLFTACVCFGGAGVHSDWLVPVLNSLQICPLSHNSLYLFYLSLSQSLFSILSEVYFIKLFENMDFIFVNTSILYFIFYKFFLFIFYFLWIYFCYNF